LAAGVFVAAWYTTHIPEGLDSVNDQITTIYYSDGVTQIGTLAKERRVIVDIADLPDYVGNAVVASEDQTFWTNVGVSPTAIARAVFNNLIGGQRQGASTLTQQYVERYYTDTVTDYIGKAKEGIIALKVTAEQPKEQILSGYLNTIYWGRGAYGIEAASQAYFGKPAAELTVSESAMLAGIIPSPSRWDPSKDEATARSRFERTLGMMFDGGFITQEQVESAAFPAYLPPPTLTGGNDGQAGYLMNEVVRELSRTGPFADNPEQITTKGLNIVTTIDKTLQDEAVRIAQIPTEGDKPASDHLQMALVSIDPSNGEIVTLYGGDDYSKVQFNYATDGRAQGGSTFKPFTLIAALQHGHLLNEVYNGDSGIPIEGWDSPKALNNYGGISYGEIDLVTATANSVNTVYAQLNIAIGPEFTADVAHQLGIPDVTNPGAPGFIADNAANVLGTASVRPIDLARAYSTIASGGFETTPHIVREVRSIQGDILYRGATEQTMRVETEIIDATTYAMQQVVLQGSGKGASAVRGPNGEARDIAGKTGTANDNLAAWFVGFTPQLVTLVGLHQDTADGLGEETITPFGRWREITGSSFPVTAWTEFMQVALAGKPVVPFNDYKPPPPVLPLGCTLNEETNEIMCPEGCVLENNVLTCAEGCFIDEIGSFVCPTPTPTPTPTEELVMIPDLTGSTAEAAGATLAAFGLSASYSYQESTVAIPGTVLSVGGAGTFVPVGTVVNVVVAQAPPSPSPSPTDPTVSPSPTETPTDPPPVVPSERPVARTTETLPRITRPTGGPFAQ
jgi:membrane peptidoglycan carboxypeptidase